MKRTLLALALSSVAVGSYANDLQNLQQRLDALEQRLDEQASLDDLNSLQQSLESYKWEQGRLYELRTANTTRPLMLSGVVQTRAFWSDTDITTKDIYKKDSGFDISFTMLGVSGNLYRDYAEGRNLNFRLTYGASPQSGAPNLSVLDAIITYELRPTLDQETGRLTVGLGQRILPFGLEVAASEELKPVIRGAQFSTDLGLTQRQIGLYLTGDLAPFVDHGFNYRAPTLAWDLGVINGNGANKTDDNGAKDLVGRLQLILPVSNYTSLLREIKLGVSGYKGESNLRDSNGVYGLGKFDRTGFDFSYSHNPIGLTVEYVKANDERVIDPATKTSRNFKSESTVVTLFFNKGEQFIKGFRAQAKYDDWWPKTYQPFIRWDEFKSETWNSTTNSVDKYTRVVNTIGFNYFFAQSSKVQFNLNNVDDSRVAKETNEVLFQVQFGF